MTEKFVLTFFGVFAMATIRYFLLAGAFFRVWWQRKGDKLKIQDKPLRQGAVAYEIKNSIISLAVFAVISGLVAMGTELGITKIYTDIHQYSFVWVVGGFTLLAVAHDTYFYWTHRAMHLRGVYSIMHKVHHRSTQPTPFAAFSFHPLEAIVEALLVPILVLFLPFHPVVLFLYALFMNVLNVIGHLGYEIYPRGFTKSFFWFINTPTHHSMHHSRVTCNYGLYFNWWDRIMGTNHVRYHEEFEEIHRKMIQNNRSLQNKLVDSELVS